MTAARTDTVSFFSAGKRLNATLHMPDAPKPPVLVHGPGWLEVRCSANSELYHRGFVEAGFAVLNFDARGFGDSEGERGWLRPFDQIEDLLSAVAYVRTRDDLSADRVGLYGVGATGGGNAIYAAAYDRSIACAVVQTVVTDGESWLRGMRRGYEWTEFLDRVEKNRLRRAADNSDELVEPREEIMVAAPERRTSSRQADDARLTGTFHLSSVEQILMYRPIDVVDRISPRALMISCVDRDPVTATEDSVSMFKRAGEPKKLLTQLTVKHYESYQKNCDILVPEFVEWYRRYLVAPTPRAVAITHAPQREEID